VCRRCGQTANRAHQLISTQLLRLVYRSPTHKLRHSGSAGHRGHATLCAKANLRNPSLRNLHCKFQNIAAGWILDSRGRVCIRHRSCVARVLKMVENLRRIHRLARAFSAIPCITSRPSRNPHACCHLNAVAFPSAQSPHPHIHMIISFAKTPSSSFAALWTKLNLLWQSQASLPSFGPPSRLAHRKARFRTNRSPTSAILRMRAPCAVRSTRSHPISGPNIA